MPAKSKKILSKKFSSVSSSDESSSSPKKKPIKKLIKKSKYSDSEEVKKPEYSDSDSEEVKKPVKKPEYSDSDSEEVKKPPSPSRSDSGYDTNEEKYPESSSDSEEEEPFFNDIPEYKSKDKLSDMPEVIVKVIADMLGGLDQFNMMKTTGLFDKAASMMHLDLSDIPMKIFKIIRISNDLAKFKTLSLNVKNIFGNRMSRKRARLFKKLLEGDNFKRILPKIIGLKLIDGEDLSYFNNCPLKSLEIVYDIGIKLDFPDLERLKIEKWSYILEKPTEMDKLIYLDLGNTNDKGLEKIFIKSPNLETLIIRSSFAGNYSGSELSKFTNLKVLEINNYHLSDFKFLSKLTKLERFIYHKMDRSGPPLIINNPNIRHIEIENVLSDLYDFSGCFSLEKLFIRPPGEGVNRVKILLDECKNLRELELSKCGLDNLLFLSGCSNLRKIRLHSGKIDSINGIDFCTNLEILDLNKFSSIKDISPMASLTKLKILRFVLGLSNKNISSLSECKKLEILDINSITLTDLTPISGCTKLKRLILNSEKISNLDALTNMTELTHLSMKYNRLKNINGLSKLHKLEYLFLINSYKLKSLKPLVKCINLNYLNISNSLNIISLDGIENCKQLETVNCKRCWNLSNINSLKGCISLKIFSLSNSNVKDISSLSSCKKLNKILLENNKLTNESKTLSKLTSLTDITSDNLPSSLEIYSYNIDDNDIRGNIDN